MPAQSIYILKLFLKNGQFMVFSFTDVGRCVLARDTVAKAINASREAPKAPRTAANPGAEPWVPPAIFRFSDDARREMIFDGADLSGVQMCEMLEDIEMETRVAVIAKRHQAELLALAGELPDEPREPNHPAYVDGAPRDAMPREAPMSSIGRFAT